MPVKISCVRVNKTGDENDYMELDLDDVYFASIFRPKKNSDGILVFHTRYGMYHWVNTLEGIKKMWRKYGFVPLDSVNVVNMKNIEFVDPVDLKVYFEDGSSTTVAKHKMNLLAHIPKKTIHNG